VGVEGTTVGNEGAGLGDITDKLHLGGLELISREHPSDLVVLEGVDKSVSLIHLLFSLGGLISKFLLLSNLTVITSSELSLDSVDFVELTLSFSKFGLSLLEGDSFDLKHMKLGLHDLGLLVIVGHSAGPSTETPKRVRGVLGDLGIEKLLAAFRIRKVKIWIE